MSLAYLGVALQDFVYVSLIHVPIDATFRARGWQCRVYPCTHALLYIFKVPLLLGMQG